MKQLHYADNGLPWDVLRLRDAPEPEPAPGEAVVALEAAPVHIADLKAIRGELPFIPRGPGAPGFEGVGRVVSCAEDVRGWAVGDRVILPVAYGCWAERIAVPAARMWRAPDHVAAEQLALVRVNLMTAYLLLEAYVALRPGDAILQNAANSSVAGYVAQLARGRDVQVVDVVRRPELVESLKAEGRDHVLLDGPDLGAAVARILTAPPRLALDAIGGAATARLGGCVAPGGLVVAYGFLAEQPYQLDYADVIFRDVRLAGMVVHRALAAIGPEREALMRRDLEAFMASGALKADIAGVYGFAEAAQAMRHAAATGADRAGKVILKP